MVLATDSQDPSGLGEHMLTLAQTLRRGRVTLAFPGGDGTAAVRAAADRRGLSHRVIDDLDAFSHWLRHEADLLHVHAGIGWEGLELGRAGRQAGVHIVRTEHLPFLLTDPRQIERYHDEVARIDRIIAVSAAARDSLLQGGVPETKLVAIPNGVVRPLPRRGREAMRADLGLTGPVLLTIARFTAQKNHAALLCALPRILAQHCDATLLLVGEGPGRGRSQALARRLGVAHAVRFLGWRDDVADLLAAADVFVLPSRFEGLPLVVLEAMAAGVPVAASRIDATMEALGPDHPFTASPRDSRALAAAVLGALDPEGAPATHRARARYDATFSADRMGEQTGDVYAAVLSQPRPRRQDMDRARIGFIGAGGIAHRHLDVLATMDDVEICAIADTDMERAEGPAHRFGATPYGDVRTMFDEARLDAVFICVPPFAHGAIEREAIARALPFFVEKPLSLDADLARAIAAEVEAAGLVTAVGYHWRYLDTVEEAARLLADNPARLVTGYWLDQTPPPRWWWRKDGSGGQVVEQTTHIIDLVRHLVGDVAEVFALANRSERGDFPGLDVATASTASLSFASGAVGAVSSTCLLRWGHRVGLHLFADGLAIELSDREIMVDTGHGRPVRGAEGDPVWREDRDFIDAVKGGENRIRSPYPEALKSHLVALAIEHSVATGQPVSL